MALEGVRGGPLCQLAGNAMNDELAGIIGYVKALSGGKGPPSDGINNFSEFYKSCLKRFEYFFEQDFRVFDEKRSSKKGDVFKVVTLHGAEGIAQLFLEIDSLAREGKDIFVDNIQPLRTYAWLLSLEQQKVVAKWVQKAIQVEAKCLSIQDAKTSAASGSKKEDKVQPASSLCKTSASSVSSLLVKGDQLKANLLASSESSTGPSAKKHKAGPGANIMHFFTKKAR